MILALGVVLLGLALVDLVVLVVALLQLLTRVVEGPIENRIMKRGGNDLVDKVVQPLANSVAGALLGAFTALYVVGSPTVAQRLGTLLTLILTFVVLVCLWLSDTDRDLPQQLYELRIDPAASTSKWTQFDDAVVVRRARLERWDRRGRRFDRILLVATLLVIAPLSGYALRTSAVGSPEFGFGVALACLVATTTILSIIGWPWLRRRRWRRLDLLEARAGNVRDAHEARKAQLALEATRLQEQQDERLRALLDEVLVKSRPRLLTLGSVLRALFRSSRVSG